MLFFCTDILSPLELVRLISYKTVAYLFNQRGSLYICSKQLLSFVCLLFAQLVVSSLVFKDFLKKTAAPLAKNYQNRNDRLS